MNILILGAAGYLGDCCSKNLKNKKYNVITTDKTGNVDILGDLSNLEFAENLPSVDIVINCAAVQYHSKDIPFFFRKFYFYKNNVQSAININYRYKNENVHLIHIGSSMMFYEKNKTRYKENDHMLCTGIYSKTKIESFSAFNDINKKTYIIPCIIGSKERDGIFKNFIKTIINFKIAIIPGRGERIISMVHVNDVVDFIILIIKTSKLGTFNISASDPLTINQWVMNIVRQLKIKKYKTFFIPISLLNLASKITLYKFISKEQILMLNQTHIIDSSKALKIGWKPKYNNKEIINSIACGIKDSDK